MNRQKLTPTCEEIIEKQGKIKELGCVEDELYKKNELVLELNQQIEQHLQTLSIMEKTIQDKEKILQSIYNSNAWKILKVYYMLRDKLLPLNSRRRLFIQLCFKAIFHPSLIIENLRRAKLKKLFYDLKYAKPADVFAKIEEKSRASNVIKIDHPQEILLNNLEQFKEHLRLFMREKIKVFLKNNNLVLEFPQFQHPIISIILVLFNKAEYTYQCLETIKAHADVPYEIIIVDNASSDETMDLLNKIKNIVILKNSENVGFLKACNQGARLAKGKWLLFLNNDTQITPSLLSTMLQTAESNIDCGAVGSKLIFPDGKMQEAGSIIWNDGSCMGYGRGEDPFKPEFSYVKEVYYCSGACLLVKNEIFKEVGMFDELFYPAYYEETDLCMKIRELGYKILFQPAAVVIHYEFGSSSSKSKALELQIANKEKFVNKWRRQLDNFYSPKLENVIYTREFPNGKYKILIIEDRIPAPELGSGYPRSFDILNCLVDTSYSVTLFPLQIPQKIEPHTQILQQKGIEVIFNTKEEKLNFKKFYEERKDYYNAVWISRPHNMEEVIEVIKQVNANQKVIYDAEALFSPREILKLELNGKRLPEKIKNKMIQKEISLINKANLVITVSKREQKIIKSFGIEDVTVLGHTYNINPTLKTFDERRDILFVGGFLSSPSPNEDAILYFLNEIYPKVYQEIGAKLWIVGTNNLDSISNLSSDRIIVTGRVDTLYDFYDKCRVFVVPTRYAAGIPFKLQECLSYGLPAVVTPLIAEQLELDENVVLIGNGPEDFSNKIIKCYKDEKIWTALRENGLKYIQKECNIETYKKSLLKLKTL